MGAYATFAAISQAFSDKPVLRKYADSFQGDRRGGKKSGLSAKAKAFFGEGISGLVPLRVVNLTEVSCERAKKPSP